MVKTQAQYQKEYLERKKHNDENYSKNERERQKQYRVPIESLSKSKQENIRRKNKAYSKNYRR